MCSTLKWTKLTSLHHSREPSKLFSLFSLFFFNTEDLLLKLDLKGLAALSGLVSSDHHQVCHIILFMNSSRAILNHLLPLIGLSISTTLVGMIKDVFYQEMKKWVPHLKGMFLMAKTCRQSFKSLGNQLTFRYNRANKTNASLRREAVRNWWWILI